MCYKNKMKWIKLIHLSGRPFTQELAWSVGERTKKEDKKKKDEKPHGTKLPTKFPVAFVIKIRQIKLPG